MSRTSGFSLNWYIDAVLKYGYSFEQKMKNNSSNFNKQYILIN